MATPLRGLAPPHAPTHRPSSTPALGESLVHPPTGRGTLRTFSRVFPPYPQSHTPADVSPRPPREAAALALVLQPLSYRVVHARAASAVWAVVERTPPPGFCGLKIWLCLVLAFCFILTFLEFSRGRSAVEWRAGARAHVPAVHSGARRADPRAPAASRENSDESWVLGAGRGPSTRSAGSWPGGGLQGEWGGCGCVRFLWVAVCSDTAVR